MPTLYTIRYKPQLAKMLQEAGIEADKEFLSFGDFKYQDYDIVKTEDVKYKIDFISSYISVADYRVYHNNGWLRFSHQFNKEKFEGGNWNPSAYPNADIFERKYNYRYNHVWMSGGDPIPADVFDVFQKLHPGVINGLPEMEA